MSAGAAIATLLDRPPDELRDAVRRSLGASPAFPRLSADDQLAIAHSLVRIAHAAGILEQEAVASPPTSHAAKARGLATSRAMNASDEFGGESVASMASTTHRLLKAISFPRFVNELISGVFKAMLETNQQQLQQYVELVRGVSQSLDGFVALGGNSSDPAKRWLADQFPESFALEGQDPDDPPDPDDEPEPLRLITRGPPPSVDALRATLSLEPGEQVPASAGPELVSFVRRSLARNRQQMLATMLQMGMQRIVVDAGRISAGMRFHIDASAAAAEQRHTGFDTRTTLGVSASGGIAGLFSASASLSSTIGYVSTTDTETREELNAAADLTSSVELHFRTDQVPLDRLASQQTVQRLQLNTLNPERELQIAAETDRARINSNQAREAARAARPVTSLAPASQAPPPAPPVATSPTSTSATAPAVAPAATSTAPASPAATAGAPAAAPTTPAAAPVPASTAPASPAAPAAAPAARTPATTTPVAPPRTPVPRR